MATNDEPTRVPGCFQPFGAGPRGSGTTLVAATAAFVDMGTPFASMVHMGILASEPGLGHWLRGSIDAPGVVVIERIGCRVTPIELEGMTRRLLASWESSVPIHLLVDLNDARLEGTSPAALARYVRFAHDVDLHARAPRVAVVAARDATFGLVLGYRALAQRSKREVRIFRRAPAALLWLRRPPVREP